MIVMAAWKGQLDVVTYLADHGADVNATDNVRGTSSLSCHVFACGAYGICPSARLSPCLAVASV